MLHLQLQAVYNHKYTMVSSQVFSGISGATRRTAQVVRAAWARQSSPLPLRRGYPSEAREREGTCAEMRLNARVRSHLRQPLLQGRGKSLRRLRLRPSVYGRARSGERLDLAVAETGLAQNFETMLAESRLQPLGRGRSLAETHRRCGEHDFAFARMRGVLEKACCGELWIGEQIVEVRAARAWDFQFAQQRDPLVRGFVEQ